MKLNPIKKPISKVKDSSLFKNVQSEFSRIKLKTFKAKAPINFSYKNFQIKTAENYEELLDVLQLRYDVFHHELGGVKANRHLIDWDKFDLLADHILVKDKETNETLATYRLLCSKFTSKFYSENEFNLNKLLDNNKVKLELGRACVATSKRRTNVVYLIWKGLATYMNEVNSDYVFGCTSLNTVDYNTAMAVYDFLKKEHFDDRFNINPLQEYAFNEIEKKESTEFINEEQASLLIPTLLKSYISAGSKICSLPAIDRDFNCVDLFTILDLENITPKYHKKYFSHFSSN